MSAAGVQDAYPDSGDYLAVYERYGLVGPKFSGGHGVWLSDGEFRRMSESGAAVVLLPVLELVPGQRPVPHRPCHRSRHSASEWRSGSDVGGGNRFSMLNVLDDAYKVGMVNNGTVGEPAEAERNKISPYRGFWSITLGGAEALYLDDMVGNFEPGKEADFVVARLERRARGAGAGASRWSLEKPARRTIDQAADLLFGVMMVGDDRAVDETWVSGRRLFKKK